MVKNIFMVQGIYGIGGATAAMLRRADEFIKKGYKCFSISFDFTEQIYDFEEKNKYKINQNLVFLNPFVELSNFAENAKRNNAENNNLFSKISIGDLQIIEYKKADNEKLLSITFSTNNGKSRIYFSKNNLCIACEKIDNNDKVTSFITYNYIEDSLQIYKNTFEFSCTWLAKIISSYNDKVLICDGDATGPKIAFLKNEKFLKFFIKHCNHEDNKGELTNTSKWLSKNSDVFDKVVFLTKEQEDDARKKMNIKNTVVIPNFISNIEFNKVAEPIINNQIGFFGRLTVSKGLKDALFVIHELVNKYKVNNVKLAIFGSNANKSLEDSIKEYVKLAQELNILDKILFNGYTRQPLQEMSRCVCVIFPSYREAQPLTIIDAMQVGTPVVAYDCNYGPRSMIKNGENGFLCDVGNFHEMAYKVFKLLNNKDMRQDMSKNCLKTIQKNNNTHIFDEWQKLFNYNNL